MDESSLKNLVPFKPASLDAVNSGDLDLEALREDVIKGMYQLEAALYTQAGFEYKRILGLRTILEKIEGDLFDPETFDALTPIQKMGMYRMVTENMTTSLDFMQNMHRTMAGGIEALGSMERMRYEQEKERMKLTAEVNDPAVVGDVRNAILALIKKKSLKAQEK